MIEKAALIGLGALGILFGERIKINMENKIRNGAFRVIADGERIGRYTSQGIYSNGSLCDFEYMEPQEKGFTADLILVGVKEKGLDSAIESIENFVGPHTLIISMLNGISSEEKIGERYGMDRVIPCVAQGMDACRHGNRLEFHNTGVLVIGDWDSEEPSDKVKRVTEFFDACEVPYEVDCRMNRKLWNKFMLNVGVNQVVGYYEGDYSTVQNPGEARDMMIAAMEEVKTISEHAGINLTGDDVDYWMPVLGSLNPAGKPSLRQDLEAGRETEVELFAGTVIKLGREYGVGTPVNDELYRRIREIENSFKK